MIAQHSSKSNEHYTPIELIEAARKVMGGIDLDPATTAAVNQDRVKAARYYTKEDDGLSKTWHGRVWLNPSGGVDARRRSNALVWWQKLVEEYESSAVTEAVFLGFSLEIIRSSQGIQVLRRGVLNFPFCIPRKRIRFLDESGSLGRSPTNANVIAYLPSAYGGREAFVREFKQFGQVVVL